MIKKIAKKLTKGSSSKKTAKTVARAKKTTSRKRRKKIGQEELNAMISARAYELFERRGYYHGDDQSDWYEAERSVTAEYTC